MWEWQQEQLSCSGKHLQHNQRTYLCVFICPAAAAAGSVCQCAAGRIPCVWLQLLQASLHTLMCKSLLRSARTRAHLQAIVVPDIWFGLANLQAGRTTRQHLYCCYVTAAYMQWTLRRHSTLRLCIVGCIIQLKHLQGVVAASQRTSPLFETAPLQWSKQFLLCARRCANSLHVLYCVPRPCAFLECLQPAALAQLSGFFSLHVGHCACPGGEGPFQTCEHTLRCSVLLQSVLLAIATLLVTLSVFMLQQGWHFYDGTLCLKLLPADASCHIMCATQATLAFES